MNRIKVCACTLTAIALIGQASAGLLDITEDYNVLTFGNFYDCNDQIHGIIAAGGNVTIENSFGVNVDANIDNPYTKATTAIVSGGNVSVSGNGQVHGSIYASGDVLVSNTTVAGDVYGQNITMENYDIRGTMYYTNSVTNPYGTTEKIDQLPDSPVDFAAKKSAAEELSNQLSLLSSNDYTISSGVLYLNGGMDNTINSYTIDASEIESITDLYIGNTDAEYIINIDGKYGSISLNSINQMIYGTSTDLNYSNILFNFINTESLNIGSFYGNILATGTDVTANDVQMYGSLVADSFSGKCEFHQIIPSDFNPPSNNVPEPSTVSIFVGGLFGLLLLIKKNRKL